ncbi:MAG TPA: hypothetical protein VII43_10155 [Opitutaceae bacterium]
MNLPLPMVRNVLAELGKVAGRFPFVVVCAVAGTWSSIMATEVGALLSKLGSATTKSERVLTASEMSARLVQGDLEWLMVVDEFGAVPEKTGTPTLTELNIYLVAK